MLARIKQLIHESRHGIFLITYAVLALYLISHLNGFLDGVGRFFGLFKPLLIGFCMAYVLNIPMSKVETFLKNKCEDVKLVQDRKRPIAIAVTILFAGIILTVLFFIIVPQLIDSMLLLLSNLGMYIDNLVDYVVVFLDNLHIQNQYISDTLNEVKDLPWNEIFENFMNIIGENSKTFGNWASELMNGTMNVAGVLGTLITSFMISLYLLGSKEKYVKQTKRVLIAFTGKDFTEMLIGFGSKINDIFRNFIGGQLLEATILFGMYYVSMVVLHMPYALLISALIAISSIIPYFGAMLGCGIGFVLIFAINPMQAVGFFIFFQILQQIENNLIYPRVVGKSVGLPAIWVVIGIMAFGSMFGMLGMIVAVPTCAVLYQAFKITVNILLKLREIDPNEESEI